MDCLPVYLTFACLLDYVSGLSLLKLHLDLNRRVSEQFRDKYYSIT